MKLDFKNFKKVECDDACTTLQHHAGHQIKIAHKGLSKEMKEELNELPLHQAKGGVSRHAKFAQRYDPSINQKAARPSQASQASKPLPPAAYTPPKMAEHAYTEPDNIGTTDVVVASLNRKAPPFGPMGTGETQHYPPCINPSCKSFGRSHPNCRCYGGGHAKEGMFAKGGEVKHFCMDGDKSHQQGCEYFAAGGMALDDMSNEVPAADDTSPTYNSMLASEEQQPGAGLVGQNPQERALADYEKAQTAKVNPQALSNFELAQASGNKVGNPDQLQANNNSLGPNKMQDSIPTPIGGTEGQHASAPEELTPEQAPPPQKAAPVQKFMAHKQATKQQLDQEAQTFEHDLNSGHITPQTYSDLFHSKNSLGQIGTIFGLLVGGAGSALAGQPNNLIEMWNKVITNDLDAQKASVTNKQNFYKINQQDLMNKAQIKEINADTATKSYALAQAQMLQTTFHSMADKAAKLPPGPEKQKTEMALNALYPLMKDKINNINDLASGAVGYFNALSGGAGNGVPGDESGFQKQQMMKRMMGGAEGEKMAQLAEARHLPGIGGQADRDIPEDKRNSVLAMNVLDNKIQDLLSFAKAHKGTISPAQRAVGEQKAHELMNFYNNSIQGGVLTEGRLKWLDEQVKKNPTSVFQDILGNNARLEEIKNSNSTRRDLMLQQLGFKGAPKSAQAPEIQYRHGVPHKRIEGGWVPVK